MRFTLGDIRFTLEDFRVLGFFSVAGGGLGLCGSGVL